MESFILLIRAHLILLVSNTSMSGSFDLQVSAHPQRGLVVSGYEKVEAKPKSLPSSIGIKLKSSSKFLDETNDWATTGLEVVGWEPKTK